jgi:hypothetical protein
LKKRYINLQKEKEEEKEEVKDEEHKYKAYFFISTTNEKR